MCEEFLCVLVTLETLERHYSQESWIISSFDQGLQ